MQAAWVDREVAVRRHHRDREFAALLGAGWVLVLASPRTWSGGIGLLTLAAVTRPEGPAYLALGLVARVRHGRSLGPRDALAVVPLMALGAYHAWRLHHFGEWWPTSYLVKVDAIPWTFFGFRQAAGDVILAAAVLVGAGLVARARWRDAAWAALPLLGQVALLWRASGDWMAWSRLMLPGIVATALALLVVSRGWRGSRLQAAAVLGLTLVCALFEPRGYATLDLQRRSVTALFNPARHYLQGLDTPLAEDVAWAVQHAPAGSHALIVDAGMLGNITDFHVVDLRGLNHRGIAEALSRGNDTHRAALMELVEDPDTRPELVRVATWQDDDGQPPELEPWMARFFPHQRRVRYARGSTWWFSATPTEAGPTVVRARWSELTRRYPL